LKKVSSCSDYLKIDFCFKINKFLGCLVFLADDCLFEEVRFFFCVFFCWRAL
jgi:hypothetical protein